MAEAKDHVRGISPQQLRLRRTARPWRIAFGVYAIALTTGTHWPRLALAPELPASDKIIHLLAFAGLTVLLWRARWISRLWILAAIGLAWAVVDEVSQGIPILNRVVSWHDALANVLGVTCAAAWLWALAPLGQIDGANRVRWRVQCYVFDEMFARSGPWLALVGGVLAGGLPLWIMWPSVPQPMKHIAVIIALAVTAVVTLGIWFRLWHQRWNETHTAMPCVECGARIHCLDFRNVSGGRCERCGSPVNATQWVNSSNPGAGTVLAITLRPAIIGIAVLVLGFGLILATPLIYTELIARGSSMRWAPRAAHFIASLPVELTNAIDLAAYLLLLAVVVRVYRTGLGRWHDRAVRCRRCGHDLRGTPTIEGTQGIGRCGECGTPFVRAVTIEPQGRGGTEKDNGLRSKRGVAGEVNAAP